MAAYPDEKNPATIKEKEIPSNGDLQNKQVFNNRTRILIVLLSTLCLTLLMANSLALNFTVICMFDGNEPKNGKSTNQTDVPSKRRLLYSDSQTSWLFWSVALGSIVGSIPIPYLTNQFGFRKTFLIYGLASAIATLLLPLSSSSGFAFVMTARFVEGIGIAMSFPAMGAIVSEWSTLKRSGMYFSYISTHLQLGTILTMPLAGELCESPLGWESLYYLLGTVTILLFALFYYFFRDSPEMHKNVSQKELATLQKNKAVRITEKGKRVIPYRAMFTDYSVLGIFAACIGATFGFQLFYQYGPLYLNKVLGFDIKNTGFASALPSVLSMSVKLIVGPLSDSVPYLSDRWRMIMFASISHFAMAFCFLLLAFISPDWPIIIAQLGYTGVILFSGFNAVGISKSAQMVSGQYAFAMMSAIQFISSLVNLVLPIVVNVVASNNRNEEWSKLFIFTAILLIVVVLIFDITAEATARPWTYDILPENSKITPKLFNVSQEISPAQMSKINFGLFEVSLKEDANGNDRPLHV